MNTDVQLQILTTGQCDTCGDITAVVAITTARSDFVLCVPCAQYRRVEV